METIEKIQFPSLDNKSVFKGPTEFSNWVIPKRLIAGAYPGHKEEPLHTQIIQGIIDAGKYGMDLKLSLTIRKGSLRLCVYRLKMNLRDSNLTEMLRQASIQV